MNDLGASVAQAREVLTKSTFKLILAHGISGDFATAMSDLPRRPSGKVVSLNLDAQPAAQLVETFMATMDRIAAEAAHRATRDISESASEH